MTMLFSTDGFDYEGYDYDEKTGNFVYKDCRSCDPEDDCILDLELEYDDFCANFDSLFRNAVGFVCVGDVRRWDGTYGGGRVMTDIGGARDFLREFTDGYRGSDYEIRVDDENGKLYVKTIDHDGVLLQNACQVFLLCHSRGGGNLNKLDNPNLNFLIKGWQVSGPPARFTHRHPRAGGDLSKFSLRSAFPC